jgi:hypothetical protein
MQYRQEETPQEEMIPLKRLDTALLGVIPLWGNRV